MRRSGINLKNLLVAIPLLMLGCSDQVEFDPHAAFLTYGHDNGWVVGENILSSACFVSVDDDRDDFKLFEGIFNIKGDSLRTSPGEFFRYKIHDLGVVSNKDGFSGSLIRQISSCRIHPNLIFVRPMVGSEKVTVSYRVIEPIDLDVCDDLAPNIEESCQEAFFIGTNELSYGIYGIFDLDGYGPSVVPLKLSLLWGFSSSPVGIIDHPDCGEYFPSINSLWKAEGGVDLNDLRLAEYCANNVRDKLIFLRE